LTGSFENKILAGGSHASCVGAAAFLDFPQMDAAFQGEAEESVLEATHFPEAAPQGVVYPGSAPSTAIPRQIECLSVLLLPAWHLAPPAKYRGLPNGEQLWSTGQVGEGPGSFAMIGSIDRNTDVVAV